jgi:surface antigen
VKVVLISLCLFLPFPAVVGSAVGAAATAPHAVPEARTADFSWVPADGYANHFPFGQCTWWAAHNRLVTWYGNAGDWLVNATAQGVPTTTLPSVGAIAVFRPGGTYSHYGHVAIVTAAGPSSYVVSEMNAPEWGKVTTRQIAWPDPEAAGFIPLP